MLQVMFPAHFQLVHSVQARSKSASLNVACMGQIPSFSHNLLILLVKAIPKCNFKSENFFYCITPLPVPSPLDLVACQSCGLPAWKFNIKGKSQRLGFPKMTKYDKNPKCANLS